MYIRITMSTLQERKKRGLALESKLLNKAASLMKKTGNKKSAKVASKAAKVSKKKSK